MYNNWVKKVDLNQAQAGMVLAQAVRLSNGNIVLKAGIQVNDSLLAKLKSLEVSAIYIPDSAAETSPVGLSLGTMPEYPELDEKFEGTLHLPPMREIYDAAKEFLGRKKISDQ